LRAARYPRAEYHRIQQIAFKSQKAWYRAVVERARQRRDEVDVPGGSAFQKAPSRHFDYHFDFERRKRFLAGKVLAIVRIAHRASISQLKLLSMQVGGVPSTPRRSENVDNTGPFATGASRVDLDPVLSEIALQCCRRTGSVC